MAILRFDLSQLESGSITNASLALTAFRDLGDHSVRVYGLDHDETNQEWNESSISFASAPGLVFDADAATRSLDKEALLLLGEFSTAAANEGDTITFSNPDLSAFLNLLAHRHGGSTVATLLLERQDANGVRTQFASKEATILETGFPVPAGTYAPKLVLDAALGQVAGLPGDFNDDSIVNLADYAVWRDNLGASAGTLFNNTTGGTIGTAQYNLWKTNFGNSASGTGAVSQATVPEPSAIVLLASIAVLGLLRLRKRDA